MANPGMGYRYAVDVLCEVSLHLIEPIIYTEVLAFYLKGGWGTGGWGAFGWGTGPTTIQIASTEYLYVGAQIVLGWGLTTQEVVTVIGYGPNGFIYTTTPVNSHSAGEMILAATFPTQQPTDPHFTQSEMLGYLSRAQNEMLSDVPVNYALARQGLVYGQIYQNTPTNCIEINRIAASQISYQLVSLTRADDEVTAVTVNPHGLGVGSTVYIQNPTAGFGGVFEVDSVPTPSSFTYTQIADDGSATGGVILYFVRMYETTSTELTMANRTWRNDYANVPNAWFEDRSGLYRWGVGNKPSSNFPVELLMGIRDTDTLGFLDGFLIPDTLCYLLKYKVLAYAWSKDGTCQDPQRAAWCEQRYQRGILSVRRYLDGFKMGLKGEAA
jgi:hypothetical protein